jgi:hypothetical protein
MPQQESRCHHSYVSSWVRQQHGERVAAAIALKPQHLKGSNVSLGEGIAAGGVALRNCLTLSHNTVRKLVNQRSCFFGHHHMMALSRMICNGRERKSGHMGQECQQDTFVILTPISTLSHFLIPASSGTVLCKSPWL